MLVQQQRAVTSPARSRSDNLKRPDLQTLAKALRINATQSNAALSEQVKQADELEKVRAAFRLIDKNGDGVLSRIEVIKALKTHKHVQHLLKLPAHIRQEDGTRNQFEVVYQMLDADDSKSVTLEEFEMFFFPPPPLAAAPVAQRGSLPMILAVVALLLGVVAVLLAVMDAQSSEQLSHCVNAFEIRIRRRAWRAGAATRILYS